MTTEEKAQIAKIRREIKVLERMLTKRVELEKLKKPSTRSK